MEKTKLKRNQIIETEILESEYPNISIAEYEGNTLRFKGGIVGQRVALRVQRRKKEYIHCKLEEVLEKSPLERGASCPMFGICGGCSYQSLQYEAELIYKLDQIKNLYKTNDLDSSKLKIHPSPKKTGYRNKMEYTFGDEYKGSPLVLGLHRRNRFYEIVDNLECNIIDDDFNKVREFSQEFFRKEKVDFYHKKRQEGVLKFMVVRKAFYKNELMVNLVTSSQDGLTYGILNRFVEGLVGLETEGQVVSVYHTISDSVADAIVVDSYNLIWGREHIIEEMNGLKFIVGPFSFFQPNIFMAEKLYSKALEYAGNIEDKTVVDLYCGTGTISQIFAQKAEKVIGVEIVEEAVTNARKNAHMNGLENTEFVCNDVLLEIDKLKEKVDLLVMDPPREGIHPKAIGKIIELEAKEIVYISCNPKTFVRDLQKFKAAGYSLEKSEVFDQFPRTSHVEIIGLLKLN